MPRPRSNVPSGIRALERGIQVLFYLSEHGDEQSIAQISAGLKLGGATVYRMLITLEGLGLVAQNPENSKYRLTTRIVEMAKRLLDGMDIRLEARPHMIELRNLTQETVGLYIRVGEQRSCIEQVESTLEVRRATALGRSFPLSSGATGKLLTAFLPPEERDPILQAQLGDAAASFVDELEQVRKLGYAVALEQGDLTMSGVAVPVRDATGAVVAGLAVSGPSSRWTASRIQHYLPQIAAAADRISQSLGYPLRDHAAAS